METKRNKYVLFFAAHLLEIWQINLANINCHLSVQV